MPRNKVPVSLLIAASLLLIFPVAFSQAPKKIKTIVVDAGHGGSKDPGAIGQYENSLRSKEKDVTLAIALKLVEE
ncbi:MAG TPA: N-acetylmuramoyl-L-alanine amidase, partial [Ferruginibacter sp.]|nr:N-acetylmuramoyl-L-alanine amidase [Ferruginibacter sp.]